MIMLTKQNEGQTITIQAEPNYDYGSRPIITGTYEHHVQRGVFGLQVEGRNMPNIFQCDEWSLIDCAPGKMWR